MYGCESWTVNKAEHWRIDAFELWCWRRLLRVPWTARRSNQSILKDTNPEYSGKDWCLSWNATTLATWCEELTHWKRAWCWERLKAGVEGDRGRDGWMASPTQWTWVWATSEDGEGRGKPGVLQSNWTTTREDYSNYFGGGWWGWRFPGIGPLPTFWSLIVGFGTVMALLGVSFTLLMYYNEHILRIKV